MTKDNFIEDLRDIKKVMRNLNHNSGSFHICSDTDVGVQAVNALAEYGRQNIKGFSFMGMPTVYRYANEDTAIRYNNSKSKHVSDCLRYIESGEDGLDNLFEN